MKTSSRRPNRLESSNLENMSLSHSRQEIYQICTRESRIGYLIMISPFQETQLIFTICLVSGIGSQFLVSKSWIACSLRLAFTSLFRIIATRRASSSEKVESESSCEMSFEPLEEEGAMDGIRPFGLAEETKSRWVSKEHQNYVLELFLSDLLQCPRNEIPGGIFVCSH